MKAIVDREGGIAYTRHVFKAWPTYRVINSLKFQSLLSWLIAGAPPQTDYVATIAELARRMIDVGIEADLIAVYQVPLNPLVGGLRYTWDARRGVTVREFSHPQMESDHFVGGVVHTASHGKKSVRYRVGTMPEYDQHPGSAQLIARQYTEYAALPFQMTTNAQGCLAVGVRTEGGMAEDQFEACRRLLAPLTRVVQSQVQAQTSDALLSSFLGRDAGARISAGMVRRGDAEMIRAVIVFTDLIGFTRLSNELSVDETVALLNTYFEALETPIIKNGGEVLKLMGDGLLAIFPTPDDLTSEEAAALSALSALEDVRASLAGSGTKFRASMHIGEIHYGNIGGLGRLDFTAIGPAVNLASRLLDPAARLGVEATCSEAFSRLVPDRVNDLGMVDLKGFEEPQRVFGVA